ncbi:MMPL family transporter [Actinoallomurus purpureus]|uniref:MMPL family transporter n=1 Tax=Actinoallomurus purpureus TaxID=478114 RepID=UPI00209333C0|nr:MMPL family transporter [Actinoallomurus purpureus]MCO6006508.1 MMPL family transporter [Actinoallomurus purpureus]
MPAWIVGAAAVIAVGFSFAAPADNDFSGGKAESSQAQDLIKKHFPSQEGDTLTLAIRADGGIDAVRPRVEKVLGELAHARHVTSVSSPYRAPGQVSPNRRTAFAPIQLDRGSGDVPKQDVAAMISDVRAGSGDGLTLALGGAAVVNAETPGGGPAESRSSPEPDRASCRASDCYDRLAAPGRVAPARAVPAARPSSGEVPCRVSPERRRSPGSA